MGSETISSGSFSPGTPVPSEAPPDTMETAVNNPVEVPIPIGDGDDELYSNALMLLLSKLGNWKSTSLNKTLTVGNERNVPTI